MDVSFSDEQEQLRESARAFLAVECPMARVREAMADPGGACEGLWRGLARLGWTGLVIPEARGGAGLGLVELSILLEETGRVLLPVSFLATVAAVGRAVALLGSDARQAAILPPLAQGALRGAFAQPSHDEPVTARPERSGFTLEGTLPFVPDAPTADLLLVPAREAAGRAWFLVERADPTVRVEAVAFTDQTRKLGAVHLTATRLPSDARLGDDAELAPVLDFARVALCAEMLGGAQRVLEMSVAYAGSREQFGRPIGAFQAIQHKCADMLVLVEGARSATAYAAWAVDAGEPDAHLAACLALAFCSDAYRRVAGEGIQIHGGLGFTWEQDLHLYYKRAVAAGLQLGDAASNRELAARALIDG